MTSLQKTLAIQKYREVLLADIDRMLLATSRSVESDSYVESTASEARAEREDQAFSNLETKCEKFYEMRRGERPYTPAEYGTAMKECLEAKKEVEKILMEP